MKTLWRNYKKNLAAGKDSAIFLAVASLLALSTAVTMFLVAFAPWVLAGLLVGIGLFAFCTVVYYATRP